MALLECLHPETIGTPLSQKGLPRELELGRVQSEGAEKSVIGVHPHDMTDNMASHIPDFLELWASPVRGAEENDGFGRLDDVIEVGLSCLLRPMEDFLDQEAAQRVGNKDDAATFWPLSSQRVEKIIGMGEEV